MSVPAVLTLRILELLLMFLLIKRYNNNNNAVLCIWASATVHKPFSDQDACLLRCDCFVGQLIVDISKGQAVLEFCAEVTFLWHHRVCCWWLIVAHFVLVSA